jgi:hypothetical protein
MASLNKVMLIGNLGADPEARSLNNGGEVVNLRLATTDTWKDRDGNKQERTEWHQVVIFNENLAKVAKNYLRKGSWCISLCVTCHRKQHEVGEEAFEKAWGIDMKAIAQMFFKLSPHRRKLEGLA